MNFKLFSILGITATLAACSTIQTPTAPTKTHTPSTPKDQTVVFQEPAISTPFYALNAIQYNAPPVFEVALQQAKIAPVQAYQIASPENPNNVTVYNVNKLIIPALNSKNRAMKFAVLPDTHEVDVTEIDDFLNLLEGKARHYPSQFANRNERRGFERKLKEIIPQLDQWAVNPQASFDVLLRAYKANVMARNLDLGQIHITKSYTYGKRLTAMNPNDGEVNLWIGFSLAEGGAQREAIPYLQKAINANVQEAYLSMANAYLGMEQKQNAITTLKNYKTKYPSEAEVADRLINEIQHKNRWNVWKVL